MRVIEQKMLQALSEGKSFKCGNTEVDYDNKGNKFVLLHGNCIYAVVNGVASFSLAGWDTVTTKSRLRALGVDIRTRNYTTFYNGVAINSRKWYNVK